MPEQDQVRLLASLELERSADVVEEMQPDDAADLLAEMPAEQRERLLTAMESGQAEDLRRLLRYGPKTAGGLMTSEPLIVTPDTPVAEVLARIRAPDTPITAAAQVYVCEPPMATPTGRYLGSVGFQRLLRRPPSTLVGHCVEGAGLRPARPARTRPGGPVRRLQPGQRRGVRRRRPPARRGYRGRCTRPPAARGLAENGRLTVARMSLFRPGERADLSVPRGSPQMGARYDADAFGRFAEGMARFLGTGRFIVGQTVLVIGWIILNTFGIIHHWDPYPFILLNLAFSTQAAYAAPLILLAQNRQDDRDRANIERDREVASRTQADTEFLARELAAVRLALADVVTTQDLEDSLAGLAKLIADQQPQRAPELHTTPDGQPGHPDGTAAPDH